MAGRGRRKADFLLRCGKNGKNLSAFPPCHLKLLSNRFDSHLLTKVVRAIRQSLADVGLERFRFKMFQAVSRH